MKPKALRLVEGGTAAPKPAGGSLPRGDGWWVFERPDRSGRALVLRYRDGKRWRDHRLPSDVRTETAALEQYARSFVAEVAKERERMAAEAKEAAGPTFKTFAQRWTSGKLAKDHPDQVREKRSADDDEARLERYVYPVCGDTPIRAFTLADAERVMSELPGDLSSASRRHVAQALNRVLNLAVYPAKLRDANPLPKGFLPKVTHRKAESWLYADEEARLAGAERVPLFSRVLYGFLAREGMRISEATGLDWSNLDLKRGAVTLDRNKTDDPRAWALDPSVARALKRYKERYRADAEPSDPVFCDADGHRIENGTTAEADIFREHLRMAGVTRPELFPVEGQRLRAGCRRRKDFTPGEKAPAADNVRLPIRLHDLRATFVTVSLATGKSERWVKDRTGHRSSQMVDRYARAARTVAEVGCSGFTPMDLAIPELRPDEAERASQEPACATAPTPQPERVDATVPNALPRTPLPDRPTDCHVAQHVAHFDDAARQLIESALIYRVGQEGLEPSTDGLKVRSSTA